jgi:hypothetical protein
MFVGDAKKPQHLGAKDRSEHRQAAGAIEALTRVLPINRLTTSLEHVPPGLNREDSSGAVYEGFYRH